MPPCKVQGCTKPTKWKRMKKPYCPMHLERIRRHGYPELKRDAYKSLEKLRHIFVDVFIRKHWKTMFDEQISWALRKRGIKEATISRVKYRRRKLGIKKYLYGEVKKHKAWIRIQAIKRYGEACELCTYNLAVDTHHIIPKHKGGPHEIDNLMVVCPNCHALITRRKIKLTARAKIPKIRRSILRSIKSFYSKLAL